MSGSSPGKVVFPNVAAHLAKWISQGAVDSVQTLSEQLWRQVIFPDVVLERIAEMEQDAPPRGNAITGM